MIGGPVSPTIEPIIRENPALPQEAKTGGKPRKYLVIFILVFLFCGLGFSTYTFFLKGKLLPAGKQPEVFVLEDVTKAEREDLGTFAKIWSDAEAKELSFDSAKALAFGNGARFTKDAVIANAGTETLYGNDLNYYFIMHNFSTYKKNSPLTSGILTDVMDSLLTDSYLLQAAKNQGLITLDPIGSPPRPVFNDKDKDYTERNKLLASAKEKLSDKFVQKISGEAISIWFNNVDVPLSVKEGRDIAKAKMDDLYQQVQNNMSFEQAREAIKSDSNIGTKVDPAWKNNAYFTFNDIEKGTSLFIDPKINDELWTLTDVTGENISSVLTGQVNAEDAFFMIIKVTERTGETATTTEEMIEKIKEEGQK